ncbi:MAG: Fe-S cluster assembly protein SufD [Actinomycetia bacterium]|nr:Fe-S cluster assembly protein SufD [Actinomycetes bacterium]MCH9801993.1 Fe-S cluster assembly protein SufD [Actinomycetes bacterium]
MTVPVTDLSPTTSSFDPQDFGVPTGREEMWRFTPMRRLRGLHQQAESRGGVTYQPGAATGNNIAIVDRDDPALAQAAMPTDRIAALGWANFDQAAIVSVAPGEAVAEPLLLTVQAQGQPHSFGQVVVDCGADASATVVIDHTGSGAYAGTTTIRVGDGARVTVAVLQQMDADGVLVNNVRAELGRDASLRCVAVTLGGDVVRLATSVDYTAPGGSVELLGAFFTTGGAHHEHRQFVDHSVPDCSSDVVYKGALAGTKAHSVWVGDVLIRAAATGTSTYETNRNLVLTDGARADSVPNLEIETGEVVGAGHAAATGRFDDEQLFYLQSRGIPAEQARKLVVRGFFADIVRRIGVAEVEAPLLAAVDRELSALGEST